MQCLFTRLAPQPTFKKPARMCREPIFSSLATKIPLLDVDRVRGDGSVALDDPPKTGFGPSTIGIVVFPLYDEAIGRATRPERTGGNRWHQRSGRPAWASPWWRQCQRWPTRRRNTAVYLLT